MLTERSKHYQQGEIQWNIHLSETHFPDEARIYLWKESPFFLDWRKTPPQVLLARPNSLHPRLLTFWGSFRLGSKGKCIMWPCFCTACDLRMILLFSNGKESKDEQYSMTHQNYIKFQLQCSQMMFYWNMGILINLPIFCGCVGATEEDLNSCDRDCMNQKPKIVIIWPFTEKKN